MHAIEYNKVRATEKTRQKGQYNAMWIIRKDGLWLMGTKASGIREFMKDGELHNVPTCIYSARLQDAKIFDDEAKARALALLIGGEVLAACKRS